METFNKTELLFSHIDNKIVQMISRGNTIDMIIESLQATHDRFQERVLKSTVVDSRFRYVYTHNEVARKRISDFRFIKTLVAENPEYGGLSLFKMFKMIKLKDLMSREKFVVEIKIETEVLP